MSTETIALPDAPTVLPTAALAAEPLPTPATLQRLQSSIGRFVEPLDGEQVWAENLARATVGLPRMYQGNPGNLCMISGRARALDVGVFTAIDMVYFTRNGAAEVVRGADGDAQIHVDYRTGMRGQLMLALMLRAGHRVTIVTSTETECTLTIERADGLPGGSVTYTLAEAQAQGIASSGSWLTNPGPKVMVFWHTVSFGARTFCPDVVLGMGYLPDELAHMQQPEPEPSEERPVRPEVQELLADLDVATLAKTTKLLTRASKLGLVDEYAGTVAGQPVTVRLLILAKAEALTLPVGDDRIVPPADTADVELSSDKGPCGCRKDVVAFGVHRADCNGAAVTPTIEVQLPIADAAPDGLDADDVLPVDVRDDVRKLLARLDRATLRQVTGLLQKASRMSVLDQFAEIVDGQGVTVRTVLTAKAAELRAAAGMAEPESPRARRRRPIVERGL